MQIFSLVSSLRYQNNQKKIFKIQQTLFRRGERDRRLYLSRERDGERERLRDLE